MGPLCIVFGSKQADRTSGTDYYDYDNDNGVVVEQGPFRFRPLDTSGERLLFSFLSQFPLIILTRSSSFVTRCSLLINDALNYDKFSLQI